MLNTQRVARPTCSATGSYSDQRIIGGTHSKILELLRKFEKWAEAKQLWEPPKPACWQLHARVEKQFGAWASFPWLGGQPHNQTAVLLNRRWMSTHGVYPLVQSSTLQHWSSYHSCCQAVGLWVALPKTTGSNHEVLHVGQRCCGISLTSNVSCPMHYRSDECSIMWSSDPPCVSSPIPHMKHG